MDLSRKRERDRLPLRSDPYWQTLEKGQSLGFRRGPDSWHARLIKPQGAGQPDERHWHPLGEGLDFDEAKRRAEAWLSQMTGTAARTVMRGSVREALESYLDHLRKLGRAKAAADAEWRSKSTSGTIRWRV